MALRCRGAVLLALAFLFLAAPHGAAQIDPDRRRLLQMGYDQPLSGPGPTGAYLFYYMNEPHFRRDDWTLRLALATVYLDSEWGFSRVAPRTDAGVGLAGGGSFFLVRGPPARP